MSEFAMPEMKAERDNSLYRSSYGAWAGNPKGVEPDYERCCKEIWSRERWSRQYQCLRPRGHGPLQSYCKQHSPAVAEARRKASDRAEAEKWNKHRVEWHGASFLAALREIAAGHNDARGLAQDVISKFDAGAMKCESP